MRQGPLSLKQLVTLIPGESTVRRKSSILISQGNHYFPLLFSTDFASKSMYDKIPIKIDLVSRIDSNLRL